MNWWDSGSDVTFANDLRASRAKVEALSEKVRSQELEIAAHNQALVQEQALRQKVESQLSEAELAAAEYEQEYPALSLEAAEAEFADQLSELSQHVDALNKEKARTEQANAALKKKYQELAKSSESLAAELKATTKKITKLENNLATVKKIPAKAVGNSKADEQSEYASRIFDEIYQRAADYIVLLLYQNPSTSYEVNAAIEHLAYAVSDDISFVGGNFEPTTELRDKIDKMMKNYSNYNYFSEKKVGVDKFGLTFYYYMYRITNTGKVFFQSVFDKYHMDAKYTGFVKRLKKAPGMGTTSRGTTPKFGDGERQQR